jgi:hypothetical protein
MSSDARKKEKKRLKRKQKHQQLRKLRSRTPLSRIASEGGRLECWVTRDWREMGMADILVLGHAPGGRCAFAAFLVDLWCVGLKDTWGESDVTELEFHDQILDRWLERTDGVKLDPAIAKRLVLGGVRFSRQSGFKLPAHWDRWASIFSPLGSVQVADTSDFGKDGGLEYVGTAKFLRERLIGSTPEEFLRRPDVKWMTFTGEPRGIEDLDDPYEPDPSAFYADDDDDEEDQFDDEELDENEEEAIRALDRLSDRLADAARKWCFANGKPPSPRLREGALLNLATLFAGASPTKSNPQPVEQVDRQQALEMGERMLANYDEGERVEVLDGAQQIQEFMAQFESPGEMLEGLGLRNPAEE